MAQQLRPSKSASKKPKIDWSRREEADNFARTVKLYRQGKIDLDKYSAYETLYFVLITLSKSPILVIFLNFFLSKESKEIFILLTPLS